MLSESCAGLQRLEKSLIETVIPQHSITDASNRIIGRKTINDEPWAAIPDDSIREILTGSRQWGVVLLREGDGLSGRCCVACERVLHEGAKALPLIVGGLIRVLCLGCMGGFVEILPVRDNEIIAAVEGLATVLGDGG